MIWWTRLYWRTPSMLLTHSHSGTRTTLGESSSGDMPWLVGVVMAVYGCGTVCLTATLWISPGHQVNILRYPSANWSSPSDIDRSHRSNHLFTIWRDPSGQRQHRQVNQGACVGDWPMVGELILIVFSADLGSSNRGGDGNDQVQSSDQCPTVW